MPHRRQRDFRFGDRTELLAEFCLNTIAFTTRVPRQEDIGHDLFCVMAERQGDNLYAGPFFTVQVKSSPLDLVFAKPHEYEWLSKLENPYFLVVGDKQKQKIDVYTTWRRLLATLDSKASKIVMKPGDPTVGNHQGYRKNGFSWIARDMSEHLIWLGKPIISRTIADLMDEKIACHTAATLKEWILLDRQNIVRASMGMHWITGPHDHATNELPIRLDNAVSLFFNPNNLSCCQRNLGLVATELRLTLEGARLTQDPEFKRKVSSLDSTLDAFSDCLDSIARKVLKEYCRLDLGGKGSE